jgi:hypothetical protein
MNKWHKWEGSSRGPNGYESKQFECKRRDGSVFGSADMMPWAVGYVDWNHNPNHPESDVVEYRYK